MQNHTQIIENLLVAQMAIEDIDMSVIRFFRRIYPLLTSLKSLNTTEMAEMAGYSDVAAAAHRIVLTEKGYLMREDYRHWKLNPHALHHPLLTSILSLNVRIYREGNLHYALKVNEDAEMSA